MIDATIMRAHQHSAGAKKSRRRPSPLAGAKGGLSTKVHDLVDALGNPLKVVLTAAARCVI
jgi:transposase